MFVRSHRHQIYFFSKLLNLSILLISNGTSTYVLLEYTVYLKTLTKALYLTKSKSYSLIRRK